MNEYNGPINIFVYVCKISVLINLIKLKLKCEFRVYNYYVRNKLYLFAIVNVNTCGLHTK